MISSRLWVTLTCLTVGNRSFPLLSISSVQLYRLSVPPGISLVITWHQQIRLLASGLILPIDLSVHQSAGLVIKSMCASTHTHRYTLNSAWHAVFIRTVSPTAAGSFGGELSAALLCSPALEVNQEWYVENRKWVCIAHPLSPVASQMPPLLPSELQGAALLFHLDLSYLNEINRGSAWLRPGPGGM